MEKYEQPYLKAMYAACQKIESEKAEMWEQREQELARAKSLN